MIGSKQFNLTVRPEDSQKRLDRTLADALPELSRTRLKTLIQAGLVSINDKLVTDPDHRVALLEKIKVTIPPPQPAKPRPQQIPLSIVYEDDDLIVIDKPAGLVVHPAPGNPDRTLVNALLAHCGESISGIGGVRRPGIVHRLDKGTSGLLVAAKNDASHQHLAALFAKHQIERAYKAIILGIPNPARGTIVGSIGRNPKNRKKMAVVLRGGKAAHTQYCLEQVFGNGAASLVVCRLSTGRTHQIRVHLSNMGHPILGDPLYGGRRAIIERVPPNSRDIVREFPHQALHAFRLGFIHPRTDETMTFDSKLPYDMHVLIKALNGKTLI